MVAYKFTRLVAAIVRFKRKIERRKKKEGGMLLGYFISSIPQRLELWIYW